MRFLLFVLSLLLLPLATVVAEDASSNPEIRYLLQYVEKADVKFIRSGKEYTPKEGAEHLRSKLQKAGGRVKTAEDFIQGIASKSYLNGDEYQVKFPNGKTTPTGPWLQKALAEHRAHP